jgi:hypothetical protein
MESTIIANALAILNGPRHWGRSYGHSLGDLVALALAKATETAPLRAEDLERLRDEMLRSIRTPQVA